MWFILLLDVLVYKPAQHILLGCICILYMYRVKAPPTAGLQFGIVDYNAIMITERECSKNDLHIMYNLVVENFIIVISRLSNWIWTRKCRAKGSYKLWYIFWMEPLVSKDSCTLIHTNRTKHPCCDQMWLHVCISFKTTHASFLDTVVHNSW